VSFDPRTEYQDTDTAEQYDQKRFSTLSGKLFQWAEQRVLERILGEVPRGSLVMDAPCGTGRLLPLYLSKGLRLVGSDISAEMINVARRRTERWKDGRNFLRMDFVQIPLSDNSVDAVFSIRFLPHFPPSERIRMLREFRRVSRGQVIISLSVSNGWMRVRRMIKAMLGHDKPVRNPATLTEICHELNTAGLKQIKWFWTFPILSEQIILICEKA